MTQWSFANAAVAEDKTFWGGGGATE